MTAEIAPIQAPFEMPQLQRPQIADRQATVAMSASKMNTQAIQQAIDKMAQQGGGTVVIPAGNWQTGRIELKSGINLHLSEGATLHFSGEIKDYLPVVFTRDEGIEIYSLGAFIYAHDAENIAITGRGRIVGPSTDCEIYQNNKEKALNIGVICQNGEMPLQDRVFDGVRNDGEVFLPKTIAPINCKNVLIEGITLDQGLYWNVVPQYCENVIIRGVTVRSFGHGRTDGIDIESSRNVLVEYCSLDCQDDTYTMKSGRGVDGVKIGRPTENVVVRHCLALRGAGGIVCGTEVAGGVNNVYCHDCVFDGTDQAFRFKSRRTRGGVFDDYHGDYQILGDPHVGDTYASSFNSQITGVVRIPGQNLWVALADRWEPFSTETDLPRRTFEAKKEAYANYQPQPRKEGSQPKVVDRRYQLVDAAHAVYHAGYVFLPITFKNGVPMIHWLAEWQLP